jgi:pimeloyl-ACP methyl ester carboxylesterase
MGCGESTMVLPEATEINLECSDGTKLAAQSWRAHPRPLLQGEELRVLCLHGWMDNCKSYYHLAPALIRHLDASVTHTDNNDQFATTPSQKYPSVHVVALDLPGHGLSSHRSIDAPPMVRAEYLFYIAEAIRELKWWNPVRGKPNNTNSDPQQKPFVLIGHSMSGGLSLMYAAAFPEQVRQLVLLDSLGHLSRPVEKTTENLRQYVQSRQMDGPWILKPENRFYYPSFDTILQVRVQSPSMFPGKQYISEEAARELVDRGVVEDKANNNPTKRNFRFRHDPRLNWNSIQYFSTEQLGAIYKDIQCPTCILLAEDGWPVEDERRTQVNEVLKPTIFLTLPGSHHLHMDPKTRGRVAKEIVQFLSKTRTL